MCPYRAATFGAKLAVPPRSSREYYQPLVTHLSDWHLFNPSDRKTYPKVDALVQVRFDNGQMEEGDSRTFFQKQSCFLLRSSTPGNSASGDHISYRATVGLP